MSYPICLAIKTFGHNLVKLERLFSGALQATWLGSTKTNSFLLSRLLEHPRELTFTDCRYKMAAYIDARKVRHFVQLRKKRVETSGWKRRENEGDCSGITCRSKRAIYRSLHVISYLWFSFISRPWELSELILVSFREKIVYRF